MHTILQGNVYNYIVMIDLNILQKEIDFVLDLETNDSLSNWFLQKKFSSITTIIGEGAFVSTSMPTLKDVFRTCDKAGYNYTEEKTSGETPILSKAA